MDGLICQDIGRDAIYLIRAVARRGIRFSKAICYGNSYNVDESDLLEYFARDVGTKIVAAYIERVKTGGRFLKALQRLSTEKPVILLKAGYTQRKAGSLPSVADVSLESGRFWNGLVDQVRVSRVYDLEELVDMLVSFSYLRPPQGRRVAIYGGGGGFGVLATDEFAAAGFVVPALPQQMQKEIGQETRSSLKSDAGLILRNPVDVANLMSREAHYHILKRLATYEGLDLLIVQCSLNNSAWPRAGYHFVIWPDHLADAVIQTHREVSKPIAVVLHGILSSSDFERATDLQRRYYEAGLPVYGSISGAAKAIDRLIHYYEGRHGDSCSAG